MRDVEYARLGDDNHVAYRVLDAENARGARNDIVMVSGGLIPMEVFEDDPGFARLLEGLRSLGRVVVFDRRGLGLSDPIVDWTRPVLDQWADDLHGVVDASGVEDAVVFAWDNWGVATRFAAVHPTRLRMLVLHQPVAFPDDRWDDWVTARLDLVRANLGGNADTTFERIAPSRAADASLREWYARAGRLGASPATAARIWQSIFSSRPSEQLLERITTPTLVLHRPGSALNPADAAPYVAALIPGARLVELDGADHWPFLAAIHRFLTVMGVLAGRAVSATGSAARSSGRVRRRARSGLVDEPEARCVVRAGMAPP